MQFKFKSQLVYNKARQDYLKHVIKSEMDDYKTDLGKKKDKKSKNLRKGIDSIDEDLMNELLCKYVGRCKAKHALAFF